MFMVLLRRSIVLESQNSNLVKGIVVVYVQKFIRGGQLFTRL